MNIELNAKEKEVILQLISSVNFSQPEEVLEILLGLKKKLTKLDESAKVSG